MAKTRPPPARPGYVATPRGVARSPEAVERAREDRSDRQREPRHIPDGEHAEEGGQGEDSEWERRAEAPSGGEGDDDDRNGQERVEDRLVAGGAPRPFGGGTS